MPDNLRPDEIIDEIGEVRRLGSLPMPDGLVSAFPSFTSATGIVPYDDATIRKLITDPDREPSRVTWGDNWVLDQKSHGSCNGHAEAGLNARARWNSGITDELQFSGAFAYSLINGHQDNGSVLEHGLLKLVEVGICPASLVTWDMIYPELQPKNAMAEAAKYRGWQPMVCEDFQQLRTALARKQPCVVAVHVGRTFSRLDKNGVCGVDGGIGNHAVVIDDLVMVAGEECFDMANSWGLSFGNRGRGYLRREHFAQTIGRHVFYTMDYVREAA